MASTMAMGPSVTAVRALLAASVTLTTHIGARLYPDDRGMAPPRPAYPFVQIESSSEGPQNTMGEPSAAKYGSEVRIRVRVVCQGTTEAQPNAISSVVKGVLDGQPITVSGYPFAGIEYQGLTPITAVLDGCSGVREWVNEYLLTVHQ